MNNIKLHVNVDHIATLRNQRNTKYPDPVHAAFICENAGANGITVHLREDRRHIKDRDVEILRKTISSVMNLEMAATEEMIGIACNLKPDIVTLVPEKREEKTTEGGLAVSNMNIRNSLANAIVKLHEVGIKVSLFIDPEEDAVDISKEIGSDIIELHTGDYCNATGISQLSELRRLEEAADRASAIGITLAAGHGLDYINTSGILHLEGLRELNIGHSIISRASLSGLDSAVREMLRVIRGE